MTAKDVMTAKPIVLESSTQITEAAEIFTKRKFSSVPVMTNTKEVAGQLTELVLLRALVLHRLQPDKYKQLVHCADMLEPALFVAPTDPISEVIKTLMKSTSRRVLVKDGAGHVTGIISPKDLLKLLSAGSDHVEKLHAEVAKLGSGKV